MISVLNSEAACCQVSLKMQLKIKGRAAACLPGQRFLIVVNATQSLTVYPGLQVGIDKGRQL